MKHGYHAFLDPTQTKAIGQVFKKEKLGIGTFDFYRCGCVPGAQNWLHLLELHRTGVALRLTDDPEKYKRNNLVGLGPHSVPLFLIKEVLAKVKAELHPEGHNPMAADRVTGDALDALCRGAEQHLQEMFELGVIATQHTGRTTIKPEVES